MIRLDFTRVTDTGISYTDALNLTQEEYDSLSPEDIEVMKQERFDNWLTLVRMAPATDEHAPDPEPEVTPDGE